MNIPLVIGRRSSGEEYITDLTVLQNLFISYSNDNQLPTIFLQFINQAIHSNSPIQFSYALSSRLAQQVKPLVPNQTLFIEFIHADYAEGKINSINEFISLLIGEMKNRKALLKKSKTKPSIFPAMFVVIDNIFEVIMSPQKKTSLSFLELLITAGRLNMFFIMGSSGIYRNLLNQLINISPSLKQKLKTSLHPLGISQPLGAELVINPDDLIFFREKNEKEYMRLYPITAD